MTEPREPDIEALAREAEAGYAPADITPVRIRSDKSALDQIAEGLSGREWEAADLEWIAEAVRATGREIEDYDEDALGEAGVFGGPNE